MESFLAAFAPVGANLPSNDEGGVKHPGIYCARPGKKPTCQDHPLRSFRAASESDTCQESLASKSLSPKKTRPQMFRPAQEAASETCREGNSSKSLSPEKIRPKTFRPGPALELHIDISGLPHSTSCSASNPYACTHVPGQDSCDTSVTDAKADFEMALDVAPDAVFKAGTPDDSELMVTPPALVSGFKTLQSKDDPVLKTFQSVPQDADPAHASFPKPFKLLPEKARGLHHSLNGELRDLEADMADLTRDLIELRRCVATGRSLMQGQ